MSQHRGRLCSWTRWKQAICPRCSCNTKISARRACEEMSLPGRNEAGVTSIRAAHVGTFSLGFDFTLGDIRFDFNLERSSRDLECIGLCLLVDNLERRDRLKRIRSGAQCFEIKQRSHCTSTQHSVQAIMSRQIDAPSCSTVTV